jgi:O-antigen ligase
MVGYTHDQLHRTMWAAATVVAVASIIAILQALLTPSLLGITPVVGQSGEGVRMGSLVSDPNILGTIIGMALPFTIFSLVRTPPGRRRWLILGAALAMGLALVLTYSRGSWIGAAIGLGGVALVIDRRAFVAFALIMVVAYGTAVVMPKGLLTGGLVGVDPLQSTINRIGAIGEMRDLRTLFVNGLPILAEHPVLGVGPGRYGGAAASVFGSPIHDRFKTDRLLTNQETVDNFWLHLGVEGGVTGIAAFLAMIGIALFAPIRAFRRAAGSRFSVPAGIVSGVVTVVVAVFTTMLLEGNTAAFLFWFLLGLGSMTLPAAVRTGDPPEAATASGG